MKKVVAERVMSALVASLAIGAPALAHHSFSAFDMTKEVEVQGVVKQFRWMNPHSALLLTSKDAAGSPVEIYIEMGGPGMLVRNGWLRESVKPGDAIKATIHPMRDGSPGGDLVKVVLPDGRTLSGSLNINFAPGVVPPGPKAPAEPGAK